MESLSDGVRYLLAAIFGALAILHLVTPDSIRRIYQQPASPNSKIRATAIVPGLSAAFLSIPLTHIWGIILGGLTLFVAVIAMLQHRRYGLAILGMLMMTGLPVAFLSSMTLK